MIGFIKAQLGLQDAEQDRQPVTHDYRVRGYGHSVEWTTRDEGMTLNANGWGYGDDGHRIKAGDYIVISHSGGEGRYQFESIKYCSNPSDMWFAKLVYKPRPPRPISEKDNL